jgi:hypothetical protein
MESRRQYERREGAYIEQQILAGKTRITEAPSDSEYIRDTYEETKATRQLTRLILLITVGVLVVALVTLARGP